MKTYTEEEIKNIIEEVQNEMHEIIEGDDKTNILNKVSEKLIAGLTISLFEEKFREL